MMNLSAGIDDEELDNDEIKRMKKHLEELQKARARKEEENEYRNATMAHRDSERDKIYKATYLSPEELERIRCEQEVHRITEKMEELVQIEDEHRSFEEEEELHEFKLLMHNHHMSVVCLSVAIVSAERERKLKVEKALLEEAARERVALESQKLGLLNEAMTARRQIQRLETTDFKKFTVLWKDQVHGVVQAVTQRLETEEAARQAIIGEAARKDWEERVAEVDELEAQLEAKMRKIGNGFERLEQSSATAAAASLNVSTLSTGAPVRSASEVTADNSEIVKAALEEVERLAAEAEEEMKHREVEAQHRQLIEQQQAAAAAMQSSAEDPPLTRTGTRTNRRHHSGGNEVAVSFTYDDS